MRPRATAFIQARMGSTRFPGKVLQPISKMLPLHSETAEPWTVLDMVCARVSFAQSVENYVVITSVNPADDIIFKHCAEAGYKCFRGAENDVMQRLYEAAALELHDDSVIVDITADCPLVDPQHIDLIVNMLIGNQLDYCSNVVERSWPDGFDAQAYTWRAFRKLCQGKYGPINPEHTGNNFIVNKLNGMLHYANVPAPLEYRHPEWELTVDWPEDLDLITLLVDTMYERHNNGIDINFPWEFTAEEVITWVAQHPGLLRINQGLRRREASNPTAEVKV